MKETKNIYSSTDTKVQILHLRRGLRNNGSTSYYEYNNDNDDHKVHENGICVEDGKNRLVAGEL